MIKLRETEFEKQRPARSSGRRCRKGEVKHDRKILAIITEVTGQHRRRRPIWFGICS
ncbi:MAG: hypothetical protein ACLSA6_18410 [Holdemania massiliensis]